MRATSSSRRERLVTGLGWVATVMLVTGLVVSLVPVRNPGVQDCGAPLASVIDARSDLVPDSRGRVSRGDEVERLGEAEGRRATTAPCSERVADRLVPAAVLGTVGMVLGVGVVLSAWIGAWRARPGHRARHRERSGGG